MRAAFGGGFGDGCVLERAGLNSDVADAGRVPARFGFALWAIALVLVSIASIAAPARAAEDVVHFASSIDVGKDSSVRDAVCFFCSVNVQGTVNGNVVVFFGSAHVDGQAKHDVVVFFGGARVGDEASVGKNLVNFFGGTRLGENASVGQDIVVMFGSLRVAASATFGGERVVLPGLLFFGPFLVIFLLVSFIRHESRMAWRRRMMLGGF